MQNSRHHWENVYATKGPEEVSWTQQVPATSLHFIHLFNLPKTASIIDIGGGDSRLVDHLLAEGFEHIAVLDIAAHALDKAKQRLGNKAAKAQWIVMDIKDFTPQQQYDVWHDRAAFHFLTEAADIERYIDTVKGSLKPGGYLVMGTFSENGPAKCSGLPVQRYSEDELSNIITRNGFEKIACVTEDHTTPFNTRQNFLFCSFKKM